MKVLNVNMSLDPVSGGGTVERTIQISREMSRNGVKVVILTTDIGLPPEYKENIDGVEIIALPCRVKRFYFPSFSYKFIKDLVKNSDVIHLMGHWTFINALVYHAARQLKKPYVVCPAGALPIYGRSRILKKLYNFVIGKEIIRNASAGIAVAVNELAHFKAYGIGPDKISLIPNGINRDGFEGEGENVFRDKYKIGDHPFILFVGRLNHIKGPDLLLKAFYAARKELAEYDLIFVGPDGGMQAELQNMAKQFCLKDRVHFVGYIGGKDKAAVYRESELLAIPSRQEAMSIVVLEAGISAKPVLITDQCGFDDIAAVNGGIVVPVSVEGIQKGLIEISESAQKRRLMGRNLRKYVEDNFTWKIAVDKHLYLYHSLLERGE
jgi:glycosyltransferase involved in cell wall biosynthesis